MKRISIIGCGGIGRRHLQGVLTLPGPLTIQVVEPNPDARAKSSELVEALPAKDNVWIEWLDSLQRLHPADFTVLATIAVNYFIYNNFQ